MLIKLAEAVGRLVLAGREMTRLAGNNLLACPFWFKLSYYMLHY